MASVAVTGYEVNSRGEAQLTSARVNIVPPDPLPRKDGSTPLPITKL